MSRRAAAATFAGCRSGITRWRNTACGGATLALCQLRCIAPAGARRRSAMWGALVRQGGATLQRHSVQCSGDQRDHGAWRVTRKGGRRIDRPHRASRSCRRDARAPGVRSRHAGATPAHLARTFTPQPSCGRDARAPGTHSRHAGGDARAPGTHIHTAAVIRAGTPAHPAPTAVMRASCPRTWRPQPSCGHDARAPDTHSRHAGGDARASGTHIAHRSRRAGATPAHLHIRASCLSRGRDARAPGTHSRHAGATPAHLAPTAVVRARRPRTWRPQPSCGRDARAPGTHIHTAAVMRAGTPAHLHIRAPRSDRNEFRSTLR